MITPPQKIPTCTPQPLREWHLSSHKDDHMVDVVSFRDVEEELVFIHLLGLCLHLHRWDKLLSVPQCTR